MPNPILDDHEHLSPIRNGFTTVAEIFFFINCILFLGFCLKSTYDANLVLSESFEELILTILSLIAFFYVYKWRQLSKQYELRQLQAGDIPRRFYMLRFLVGGSGIFLSGIGFATFPIKIEPPIPLSSQLEFLLPNVLMMMFGLSLICYSIISKNLKKILNTANIR